MKVGDAVRLKKPKTFQADISGCVGIIVEVGPWLNSTPNSKQICRVFWPNGNIDKPWRICSELEKVS